MHFFYDPSGALSSLFHPQWGKKSLHISPGRELRKGFLSKISVTKWLRSKAFPLPPRVSSFPREGCQAYWHATKRRSKATLVSPCPPTCFTSTVFDLRVGELQEIKSTWPLWKSFWPCCTWISPSTWMPYRMTVTEKKPFTVTPPSPQELTKASVSRAQDLNWSD